MQEVPGFVQVSGAHVSKTSVEAHSTARAPCGQWLVTHLTFTHRNYLPKYYLGTIFLLLQREGKKAPTRFRIPFSSLPILFSISLLKAIDWIFNLGHQGKPYLKRYDGTLEKEYSEPEANLAAYWKCVMTLSELVKQLLPVVFSVGRFLYLKELEMA